MYLTDWNDCVSYAKTRCEKIGKGSLPIKAGVADAGDGYLCVMIYVEDDTGRIFHREMTKSHMEVTHGELKAQIDEACYKVLCAAEELTYAIQPYGDTGLMEVVRNRDSWADGDEALRDAISDGVRLLTNGDLPKGFPLKGHAWIDTPANREKILGWKGGSAAKTRSRIVTLTFYGETGSDKSQYVLTTPAGEQDRDITILLDDLHNRLESDGTYKERGRTPYTLMSVLAEEQGWHFEPYIADIDLESD